MVPTRVSRRVLGESAGGGAKVWAEIIKLSESPSIVCNLGQGFPDFAGTGIARTAACSVIKSDAKLNQYSPVPGIASIRQELASLWNKSVSNSFMDSDKNVLCTTSGTEALYVAMQSIINPGDEVLVFEPFFPWYLPAVRMAGGIPIVLTLKSPQFDIDFEDLKRKLTPKTKCVMFNTPHNPTGHVASKEEIEKLSRICIDENLVCVSDEVYEHFIFSESTPHMKIADVPGMQERTLTIGSASKMFSLTGWRVGWMFGPEDIISACRTIHAYSSYCAPTPLQYGTSEALREMNHGTLVRQEIRDLSILFRENAAALANALENIQVQSILPDGGYFLVCDVSKTGKSDTEFARWLATVHGIVCVPMSCFYDTDNGSKSLVRFAVCKTRETIQTAVNVLSNTKI